MLSIGQLAQQAGMQPSALRYYERMGLLDPTERVGGQRRYHPAVLGRLMVIKFCAFAGLSLEEIATILTDESEGRRHTRDLAAEHAERITLRLAELSLARDMMLAVSRCGCPSPERCACGAMEPVIMRLREHLQATLGAPSGDDFIHVAEAPEPEDPSVRPR